MAEVLRDALALSPEVRAALIDCLISSLDQAVDAGAEEAWREEIARRVAEIRSGQAAGRPSDELLPELRERYP